MHNDGFLSVKNLINVIILFCSFAVWAGKMVVMTYCTTCNPVYLASAHGLHSHCDGGTISISTCTSVTLASYQIKHFY